MQPSGGRRVVLGITAGIAAFKAAELARLLVRDGADVQVVMTRSAGQFIGPMTLQAITGRPVRDALFDPVHEAAMGHIELARWADVILVAPATADFIARIAIGMADDLLSTLCLASGAPLLLAPAMNQAMWGHPATQANVAALVERGATLLGPDDGDQACGDTGPGRMREPAALLGDLQASLVGARFAGRRVIVTAGPTQEPLDPVRFLGNRSSGKMGFALAAALTAQGAEVVLISGPVALPTPRGVERIDVESALQMRDAVLAELPEAVLFIACAAVADYRPLEVAAHKIKKEGTSSLKLELVRNPDILAEVSARAERPFCVGFAAETDDLEAAAESKMRTKGLDMIAANQVSVSRGFGTDDNALLVIWNDGRVALANQPKTQLAVQLVDLIADRFDAQAATKNSG